MPAGMTLGPPAAAADPWYRDNRARRRLAMGRLFALTLLQPWAWCIAHADKRVENRDWRPPDRLVGGLLAIHAGKKVDVRAAMHLSHAAGVLQAATIDVRSAVVAVVRLVDVVTDRPDDPWFTGPVGWVLGDVATLTDPVSVAGHQGLWMLDADTHAAVMDALPPEP